MKQQRKKWNSSILSPKAVWRVLLTFRVLLMQEEKSFHTAELLRPASQSREPQPLHYMVVTAHLGNLITPGLLGTRFPQCTGDRHLSESPDSQAQIPWQQLEKYNNQLTTKHSEAKCQRLWQMAVVFWQQLTRSHMQVKLCCEQTAEACYGQGLSKEKTGKWMINLYLSQGNINLFSYCGGQCIQNTGKFKLPVWDADLDYNLESSLFYCWKMPFQAHSGVWCWAYLYCTGLTMHENACLKHTGKNKPCIREISTVHASIASWQIKFAGTQVMFSGKKCWTDYEIFTIQRPSEAALQMKFDKSSPVYSIYSLSMFPSSWWNTVTSLATDMEESKHVIN